MDARQVRGGGLGEEGHLECSRDLPRGGKESVILYGPDAMLVTEPASGRIVIDSIPSRRVTQPPRSKRHDADESGTPVGIRWMKPVRYAAFAMANCLHAAQCHPQGSGRLVTETFIIAAADPDIKLHVRYK